MQNTSLLASPSASVTRLRVDPGHGEHTGVLEANPQRAARVFEDRRRLVAGESLGRPEHRELLLAEPVQAAAGADPEAAVAILEEVPHRHAWPETLAR